MVREENLLELDDFIKKPSNLSRHIIGLANEAKNNYYHLLVSKKIMDKVRIRLFYLNKYSEIYDLIQSYKKKRLPDSIESLFMELKKVFDYIALNNILLTYAFLTEKNKTNPIVTKEDEKLLYLKKLYNNEISTKEFNDMFGHYALNAFELSSKRFSEYSEKELKGISRFLKHFQLHKKVSIEDYLKNKRKNLFAVYSTLREELKYIALRIINDLRFGLLRLAKEKDIKNIFAMSYNEIQRKGYC